jgi:hypothetical protein
VPELRNLVDAEVLLVAYLRADSGVAALVDTRVSTELPAGFRAETRVQLFRTGGVPDPSDVAGHLDRPSIQINAFGATKGQAFMVAAETIRAVIAAPKATFAGAVVSHATRVLGPIWSPDPDTDIPRYILGVVLWIHPTAP